MDILFFLYSALLYIIQLLTFASSRYTLNEYDMSIRILAHEYASRGLIPYLDFGQVWPPGPFVLSGILLPYALPFRNMLFSVISFVLTLISGFIIVFFLRKQNIRPFLPLAFLLLLEAVFVDEIVWSEPFSRQLLVLVVLLFFWFTHRPSWSGAVVSGVLSLIIVWFRWNILLSVLFVWWVVFILDQIRSGAKHEQSMSAWLYIGATSIGAFVGMVTLGVYLWQIGALTEGIDFIIRIPLAILPYRGIPIPGFSSAFFHIPVAIYGSLCSYSLLLYILFRSQMHRDTASWLLALFPLGIFPYAFIRAEETHVRNFPYVVAIVSILLLLRKGIPKKLGITVLGVCTALVLILRQPSWGYLAIRWPFSGRTITESITDELSDCRASAQKAGHYVSLFVGRAHYEHFVLNSASLYLINPLVPPATVFIDETPSIQNSLYYGAFIAQQLSSAPKPMLAFLEASEQVPEPNQTRFMKTQYMIEDYLSSNPYTVLGTCQAHGKYFLVRRYL